MTKLDGAIKRGAQALGAIKRGAQALGAWMIRGDEFAARGWSYASAESLALADVLEVGRPAEDQFRIVSSDGGRWDVDALVAAVHVLLLEAGHTIERPCPECRGGRAGVVLKHGRLNVTDDACPACAVDGKPTGRVHVEAARVLLDVVPRPMLPLEGYGERAVIDGIVQGCPAARADLHVLADALMDPGDPTGQVLALWLAGELREEHVLGVELHRGHSAGCDKSTAEFIARGWLTAGALGIDVEQLPDMRWQAASYWERPALEASPKTRRTPA